MSTRLYWVLRVLPEAPSGTDLCMSNPWGPPRNLQPYIVVPAGDIFFMEDGAPGQSPVLIPNSLCGTECGGCFLDLYEVR